MRFRIILILTLIFYLPKAYPQQTSPVKIGLLISDKASQAARQGAELAINNANKKGGFNGRQFQLVTRDMAGPWGTGSKQAVDLIFENEVWALLGSHDGRNAHLVEQASAKSIVTFVSAWSSDPSLAQAFIPWFFNCVPSDEQQAMAMIDEIYRKRKISRIITITDSTYDSNQSLKGFLKIINKEGRVMPFMFNYENYQDDLDALADKINKKEAGCIILFCSPPVALKIVRLIHDSDMKQPVLSSLSIMNENVLSENELREFDNILIASAETPPGSENNAFAQQFYHTYGKMPGLVSSYAFDGMNVLIEAIKIAGGPEREKIQLALTTICYDGVTGSVQFDKLGNRKGIPVITPVITRP